MSSAGAQAIRPLKTNDPGIEKRACLIAAAVKVFMAQGYHASMDRIAAQADVAKQTVYNHFGSKEKLFEEVVRTIAGTFTVPLAASELSVRDALIVFASTLRARTLSPEGIGVYRALVAEAPRFPSLAKLIYKTGAQATRDALAEFLEQRMHSGEIRQADAGFSAQMLMSMLTGYERTRLLFGGKARESQFAERRECERIVDSFLRTLDVVND